jgi:hypothetical protein
MPDSIHHFTKTEYDGTKVTVTITVDQDHYPTWAKWVKIYLESPIAYGLEREG